MTLVRGWKARRDAAAKNAKREIELAEIRRERARLYAEIESGAVNSDVESVEFAPVVDTLVEAPAQAETSKSGRSKKEKPQVLIDNQYLVEE